LATPGRTGVYALFYVWVAVCAAYFLTWFQVGMQAIVIAVCYAIALFVQGPEGAGEQWVIGVGTVSIVALLVGGLRRGVAGLFSRMLPDTFRRIDRVARTAGEEFAVVLPDTEGHSAYLLAERLRRRLADESPADPIQLSVSVGVATSPKHGLSTQELLQAGER